MAGIVGLDSVRKELHSPFAWDRYLQDLEYRHFDLEATQQWARSLWPWIFVASAVYVVLCYLGVRYMRDREPFKLRKPLVLWNTGLAAYSIFALWRMIPHVVIDVMEGRYSDLACSTDYFYYCGPWAFLFPLSKLFEFGDTMFVVLKKKPLIFLHYYHHVTVLWMGWLCFTTEIGPGRVFSTVNLFVHSLMYTYYGVVASGLVRLPKWINMTLTGLQLSQMVLGVASNLYGYYRIQTGQACDVTDSHMMWGLLMYFSYMLLFANYFYQTYVVKARAKPQAGVSSAANGCTTTKSPTANGRVRSAGASGNGRVKSE